MDKLPQISKEQADKLFGIAGSSSINPLIFMSLIEIDGNYIDEDVDGIFGYKIKHLAKRLTYDYYSWTNKDSSFPSEIRHLENELTYSLWKELSKDVVKLVDVIRHYNLIKLQLYTKQGYWTSHANKTEEFLGAKKDRSLDGLLVFPTREKECWQIGN